MNTLIAITQLLIMATAWAVSRVLRNPFAKQHQGSRQSAAEWPLGIGGGAFTFHNEDK